MKKVQWKAFMKKFIASALAAAMIISTPSTAFATDFADNFATVDDASSDNANPNNSQTEMIEPDSPNKTDTTTINSNIEKIKNIVIYGPNAFNMTSGKKSEITAVILTDGINGGAIAAWNRRIKWTSSDPTIVSIDRDEKTPNKCILNARNAGDATITAELKIVGYNEDGSEKEGETSTISASVNVHVYALDAGNFAWNIPETVGFHVKHTYCLSDYLYMNGTSLSDLVESKELSSASEVVTFAVNAPAKVATIDGDKLTIKGAGKITLRTFLPDKEGVKEGPSKEITADAGNPVTKLIPTDSSPITLDFGKDADDNSRDNQNPTQSVEVEIETNNNNDDDEQPTITTDDITWTSSNELIATVVRDLTDQKKAVIKANPDGKLGKATITAKATSGKTAKFNVTVKATLVEIKSVSTNGAYAWSGKAENLKIERVPRQNKDKLKVTVTSDDTKKLVKIKSTADNVTITPVADLKLKELEIDEEYKKNIDGNECVGVELLLETTDKNSEANDENEPTKIWIRQSDITLASVVQTGFSVKNESKGEINHLKVTDKKTAIIRTNPGETFKHVAKDNKDNPIEGGVSWISSNVKVADISDNGDLSIVGSGTAKITVSSVCKSKKDKTKYETRKITFTVKSTPKCEKIELKSNVAAYDLSKQKNVTFNIKQQSPKGANDEIEWWVNGIKQEDKKKATDKKLTLDGKNNACFKGLNAKNDAGSTITVKAVSKIDNTVYAEGTIYVIKSAATKVTFNKKNVSSLGVGATTKVKVTGSDADSVVGCTVDQKGVGVVKVELIEVKRPTNPNKTDKYVVLTGIGAGKATVTAFTASGKKGSLKVEVVNKSASGSGNKK